MVVVGAVRARNAERWIERCIASLARACDHLLLLDDRSHDNTAAIAARFGARILRNEQPMNEARDRQTLWDAAAQYKPDWFVSIDADEELVEPELLRAELECAENVLALCVIYVWAPGMVRTDGIYGRFWRPSARRWRPDLKYRSRAPHGLHCGCVPGPFSRVQRSRCPILHYGYEDVHLRRHKFAFYREIDPHNQFEDGYRHIVIGDPGGLPANAVTRHAGPLRLRPVNEVLDEVRAGQFVR